MLRFISFLFNKPYETCKSCETLKNQLAIANEEKKVLTNTLLDIIKPKVIEAAPIEINPIGQTSALFSKRRAALEEKDRQEARILAERRFLAVPDDSLKSRVTTNKPITPITTDTVEKLEQELGIDGFGEKMNG